VSDRDPLQGRCGTCARFVRVFEHKDDRGQVRRAGECLLGVWSPPLYENNTCSQYLQRGTVAATVRKGTRPTASRGTRTKSATAPKSPEPPAAITLPEELFDMDADEFREVLRQVVREELGASPVELGGRWQGGEIVLKPGKEGTSEKRLPIESFFHKVVMVRDRLRLIEQKINAHPQLTGEDKVQLQQYVTQCYGTLTTFNVLFANREDAFVGQRGDRDE
jgi:hypothetical protein